MACRVSHRPASLPLDDVKDVSDAGSVGNVFSLSPTLAASATISALPSLTSSDYDNTIAS